MEMINFLNYIKNYNLLNQKKTKHFKKVFPVKPLLNNKFKMLRKNVKIWFHKRIIL